jgi:hypothetical protein
MEGLCCALVARLSPGEGSSPLRPRHRATRGEQHNAVSQRRRSACSSYASVRSDLETCGRRLSTERVRRSHRRCRDWSGRAPVAALRASAESRSRAKQMCLKWVHRAQPFAKIVQRCPTQSTWSIDLAYLLQAFPPSRQSLVLCSLSRCGWEC